MSVATWRAALVAAALLWTGPSALAQSFVDVDQNWSAAERSEWYAKTQGSRLMPLDWFLALEQPGSEALFTDPAYLASFRYLQRPAGDPLRPLPIGFVEDQRNDERLSVTKLRWKAGQGSQEKWVGLTCSACHTAQIEHGEHVIRVDGGPTLADFQGFFGALNRALAETRDDPAKFSRFAQSVLGRGDREANSDLLEAALASLADFLGDLEEMNRVELQYGFGRLDAIGFIYNKVSRVVNGSTASANPSNAPVSYPFIWNIPQHDRVQWNGMAENLKLTHIGQPFDVGALGRNTGEVIGVFADVMPSKSFPKDVRLGRGFRSSADVDNLVELEQQLGRLRPPRWPGSVLGAIESSTRDAGERLFDQHCVSCHAKLGRTDLRTPIVASMTRLAQVEHPIGTDPWMACNAYTYDAGSGILEGARSRYFTGDEIEGTAYLSDLLTISVGGILWRQKREVVRSAISSLFDFGRPARVEKLGNFFERLFSLAASSTDRLEKCLADDSPLLAYKGRPLTGIWATAPYLHNGSVPTLYDLLLPPEERPASFRVGTRQFDPVRVGYVTSETEDGSNSFEFRTVDAEGKAIQGNSNGGHDYGNGDLDEAERMALIEYMKSL